METRTSDYNSLTEIEDLRCERLPETADKQVTHKKLLKVIILGDTGKSHSPKLSLLGAKSALHWFCFAHPRLPFMF